MTPRTDTLAPHLKPGRKASWFELFFDLAFVTAVAQLTAALAAHYDALGFAQFGFLLLLLWWTWLGQTFHSTRFDEDRPDQHGLGMVQIAAVVVIGYGAGDAFGAKGMAFALGMGALKALLMAAYLREWPKRPAARGLVKTYGSIYALQAMLWTISAALEAEARWALWGAVLLLDMVSPALVARHTHGYPPHPEHLPERFGLFTIIVMGEGVAATLHALLHAEALSAASLGLAALGLALAYLYWVGYYERVGAQHERHVHDAAAGARLRRWAYGHVPLLIGVGGGAAGLVAAAGHHAGAAAPWIAGGCIGLAIAGITAIGRARPHGQVSGSLLSRVVLALLPLAAAAWGSMAGVYGVGVAVALAQVRLGRRAAAG